MISFIMSILLCFLFVYPASAEITKTQTKTVVKQTAVTTSTPVSTTSSNKTTTSAQSPVMQKTAVKSAETTPEFIPGNLISRSGKTFLRLKQNARRIEVKTNGKILAELPGAGEYDLTPYLSQAKNGKLTVTYYDMRNNQSTQDLDVAMYASAMTAQMANVPRDMVIIKSLQFAHVSGDVYSWQATLENRTQIPINNVVLMLSKKVNGSWAPAGDQITINYLAAGNSNHQGSGAMSDASNIKLDVLANSPLTVVGSKTVPFITNGADLANNLDITSVTVLPYEGRFQWMATIVNNNNVAFNEELKIGGQESTGGSWNSCGFTTIDQMAPGESENVSLTFWRNPDSTQFRIILKSNNQIIKESTPIALEPIIASVNLSNVAISKQGTIASWSLTVTNSGNINLSNVRVKTYHRQAGGEWTVASNTQNIGSLATGANSTKNGIFTPGTSTQFKLEIVASSFSENYGDIIVGTHEINF